MIDFHSHSFFSDGALVPSEQLRRVEILGYKAIAITDHADSSNLEVLIQQLQKAAADLNPVCSTRLIIGVELTHVPPPLIAPLTLKARELGAEIVVVHGETPVEPVAPGTNRAAIDAGVDLLAHPGFLTEEEAVLARTNQVMLELSARKGHSLTNGHVAGIAEKTGALLGVCSDAHEPSDFMTTETAQMVAQGAGLTIQRYSQLRQDMDDLLTKITSSDMH